MAFAKTNNIDGIFYHNHETEHYGGTGQPLAQTIPVGPSKQNQDIDLNGNAIYHYPFNARASGGLHGNGTTNEVQALTAFVTKVLADATTNNASEIEIEFPRGRYLIAENFTFPETITVKMHRGAVFIIGTGATLTINKLTAGTWRLFEVNGTGQVSLPKVETIQPEWFGAVGNGSTDDTDFVQLALNQVANRGGTILFSKAEYTLLRPVNVISDNIRILGNNTKINVRIAPGTWAINVGSLVTTESNITAPITAWVDTFTVVNASIFQAGDNVRITTDEPYFTVVNRDYKRGEMITVKSVNTETNTITSETPIVLDYRITNIVNGQPNYALKAVKLTTTKNIYIDGLNFVGTGSYNDQGGIKLNCVKNAIVTGCTLSELECGVGLFGCLNAAVTNSFMHHINKIGAGYGVNIADACKQIIVSNNRFEHNRHSVSTTGYTGVCMDILIEGNVAREHYVNSVINTHGNARFVSIIGNNISGAWGGITTYSPCSLIANNNINNTHISAIYLTEAGGVNAKVIGNIIHKTSKDYFNAIEIYRSATVTEQNQYVTVENNTIVDATNGEGIHVNAGNPVQVSITGNVLRNIGFSGIRVEGAEKILVANNSLEISSRADNLTLYAIDLVASTENVYGNVISIHNNIVDRWANGVRATGQTISAVGNVIHVAPANTFWNLTASTTLAHAANIPAAAA